MRGNNGVFQFHSGHAPLTASSFGTHTDGPYRFTTTCPFEPSVSLRSVGDRFSSWDSLLVMNAYTLADADTLILGAPRSYEGSAAFKS